MTLSDLGNLGELVSAIAVVVSLLYLAAQIRQIDRSTQLSDLLEKAQLDIGPLRRIDTLYRVREMNTDYVATGGCGELYAYPIFIAEDPSPFSHQPGAALLT